MNGEYGVVERGFDADGNGHCQGEREQQEGAEQGNNLQAPADEQAEGEDDLGDRGDPAEGGDGRFGGEAVERGDGVVKDVVEKVGPVAPGDARGAGRSSEAEAIGDGGEIAGGQREAEKPGGDRVLGEQIR